SCARSWRHGYRVAADLQSCSLADPTDSTESRPGFSFDLGRGRGGQSRPCQWGPTTALLHRVTFSADHAEARLAAGLLLLLGEPPAVVFRRPRHVTFVHNVVAREDGRGPHARHLHNRVVRLSSPPQIAHGAPTEVME